MMTQLCLILTRCVTLQIIDVRRLRVVVWERGVGLTQACGTGACAAVVAAILNHVMPQQTSDNPCLVDLPGGTLSISWREDECNGCVLMTGPATFVFSGIIEI